MAVCAASGIAAAFSTLRPAGLGATTPTGAATYSANAPGASPSTSSPIWNADTPGPTASTVPGEVGAADPLPSGLSGRTCVRSASRATRGSPRMTCQSRALTEAACTRTTTSPGPGTGMGTSSTRSTSGEP